MQHPLVPETRIGHASIRAITCRTAVLIQYIELMMLINELGERAGWIGQSFGDRQVTYRGVAAIHPVP